MLRIYTILGGFIGFDGYVTSAGLYGLNHQIEEKFPYAKITTYTWSEYRKVGFTIAEYQRDRHAVIAYSGGGSRATWLANVFRSRMIDRMILYDPSPHWQMMPIGNTGVVKALVYQNSAPFFFGYGGGAVEGRPGQVQTVPISMNHVVVQFSQELHNRTLAELEYIA